MVADVGHFTNIGKDNKRVPNIFASVLNVSDNI
jgi:hypothetical protein